MNKQDFIVALTANNLDQYLPRFEAMMEDSIRYTLHQIPDYKGETPGPSRIGGLPDFPKGISWPEDNNGMPLAFIAQLNLQEIKPYDIRQLLPDTGYIYFFYDADQGMGGYAPEEKHLFKVFYLDVQKESLSRLTPYPEKMPEIAQYWPCNLTYANEIFLPDRWSDEYEFMTQEEKDLFFTKVYRSDYINKTFGIADILQGNDMPRLCQKVYPESAEEDWILLLQVDSNELAYMAWCDIGRLYFWIRKQDLEQRNFDNCWCVMQDL